MNALDGKRYRIADGGFFAGETNERLHEQNLYGLPVERQRHLQVSTLAEQYQPDAIAFAAADEVAGNGLGCRQSIDTTTRELEILLVHAAGQVDREHQVAARYRDVEFVTDALRPCAAATTSRIHAMVAIQKRQLSSVSLERSIEHVESRESSAPEAGFLHRAVFGQQ